MSIPINNTDYLPFKPNDWVKVIKKPARAIAIKKGDVIQIEQVNPKEQLIRISDPDLGWQYLSFDEVELTLPSPQPVVTGTTNLSVRDDKPTEILSPEKALYLIHAILNRLEVSVRDDVIDNLLSVRDDTIDNGRLSELKDIPKIIWRSPGGREAKYPWFEYGRLRAYIGGGDRASMTARKRVELVQRWIDEGIPPSAIYRRVKSKNFPSSGED